MTDLIIHRFRQDLRISDNPSLYEAAKKGRVLPIYIFDDSTKNLRQMGESSLVWLHYALHDLNKKLGGNLKIFKGEPAKILSDIINKSQAKAVYWNRCYEPWAIVGDKNIKEKLKNDGIEVESFNGSLLLEPWEALKDDGSPYRVFTPFYKKNYQLKEFPEPLKEPEKLNVYTKNIGETDINSLKLLPEIKWHDELLKKWDISEDGAKERLFAFLDDGIKDYKKGRNFPAQNNNSRLSPYLHFGQISPRQIWNSVLFYEQNENTENFCVELAWREFSYNLLYYYPDLPWDNLQKKFDKFPWKKNDGFLKKWQKGMTGYPIVDAGMRELWQTGFMHNRIRMVVASFLVKNLLIDWREGEKWFWDCLFDADLANNAAGWQWVAGCGADAAPYFRVFNPINQGERFDASGQYTRKYVPELAKLPDKYLFKPWEAPQDILDKAKIELGKTYPYPIIDAAKTRKEALGAYEKIK
ncbi:MAG: deoxyribodipyrimidine photo-lyase [Rickettsiales bacterium]|nr:deoxyribodipyrimidine photo-lyase [Pseudomonadota bacterium]MDA0965575.1 deoxyribodipyrimidine photo-lyase [Pseudomonadota bacterium]MDG4542899.1 deoxyribodipyrimidine photo-lyase [Rickettsiales bacterium]MDG4544653.1 deoxyribodipyrimidine photo-lyase [Rickettsiales bacterium]MDG4546775.1 deoxyribodipyrimidine photo-lyase [Rickettsiales bacterium]